MKRIVDFLNKYTFLLLSIITTMMFLYCCDFPIYSQIFWFLVNHKNEGDLLYNIGVSFIAAYIFYILQVFIPEKKKKYVEIRNNLPKRVVVCKEVKQFLNRVIRLWQEMYISTAENEEQNLDVDYIFESNNIDNMSGKLNLYDEINEIEIDHINKSYRKITWIEKIVRDTSDIIEKGKFILCYYNDNLPGDVSSAIYTISNESMIVHLLNLITRAHFGDKQEKVLRNLLGRNVQNNKIHDFSGELKEIKIIDKWLLHETNEINSLYGHKEI